MSEDVDFRIVAPAWRIRRLRGHLTSVAASGTAARQGSEARIAPAELAHRAEVRRWLAGWDHAVGAAIPAAARPPSARQLAKLARWQAGAGRLRPADGAQRRAILEAVADEMLAGRPLAFGAIAAACRETARRCRAAGLPAPKASRYRRWLKLSRGI